MQRFMGKWGLAPALEEHMCAEALASIRESGAALMGQTAAPAARSRLH
jgi:hypothetical protein